MARPFPGKDVPVIDQATGTMSQTWYDYFQSIRKLSTLPDVSTTAPTNGQVLIWDDTTKLWVPGAN
ncbi:hypothetical protein ACWAT4_21580 [Bradyrhizobium manausense]